MKKLLKPALAIVLCAALTAGIVALPELVTRYNDAVAFSDALGSPRPVSPRDGGLSGEGMQNEVARALFIDHTYVSQYTAQSMTACGEGEFERLKEAGIVPLDCFLADYYHLEKPNCCVIYVEPVSRVVTSIQWNGEGIDADELFVKFMSHIGISDADDWRYVEYKGPYQNETTLGRYSPSLQLYVFAYADEDNKSSVIGISSHTAAEMEPLLTLNVK